MAAACQAADGLELHELSQRLKASLRALHSVERHEHQREANAFLSDWRTAKGSWMQAARLVHLAEQAQASPQAAADQQAAVLGLQADEMHFLASVVHNGLQKDPRALEDGVHNPLIASIVAATKRLWHAGWETQATRVQLCLCMAVLVVRHPSWDPAAVLGQLSAAFQGPAAQAPGPGSGDALQWLGPFAELLALLPEECQNRKISVHPARRQGLIETLQASPDIVRLWEASLASSDQRATMALLRGMRSFSELGSLPRGLCSSQALMQLAFHAVADGGGQLSDMGAQAVMAMCSAAGNDPEAMTTLLEGIAALIGHFPPEQWGPKGLGSEFCELLVNCWTTAGMAGAAAMVAAAAGSGPPLSQRQQEPLNALLRTTLTCLSLGSPEIVAAVLDMWDTGIVSAIAGLQPEHGAQLMALQHLGPYLEAYLKALVCRTALHGVGESFLTGDARDLPSDVRALRRELGAEIRSLTDLVGPREMLGVVSGLLQEGVQLWQASVQAGGQALAWQPLEAALYSCVIVSAKARADMPDVADVMRRVIDGALTISSAAETAKAPKMAGTALVFLGGLHTWLIAHPPWLSAVLDLCIVALRADEPQLVRNGADAFRRLASDADMARVLALNSSFSANGLGLQDDPARSEAPSKEDWCSQLVGILQARGGMRQRSRPGTDISTEQLLLLGLCSVAVSVPDPGAACSSLSALVSPAAAEVQHLATLMHNSSAAAAGALSTFCDLLGVLCAIVEATARADMATDLQTCLWGFTRQAVISGQGVADLYTKANLAEQASQVANACCELVGSAVQQGGSGMKLAGMHTLQQLCSGAAAPEAVLAVLEACLPHMWTADRDARFAAEAEELLREIVQAVLSRLDSAALDADPALHAQVMRLGTVLLCQRPSLLSGPRGRPLAEHFLGLGVAAMSAQHRGLCEDALEWTRTAVAACSAPLGQAPTSPQGGSGAPLVLVELLGVPGAQAGPSWGPRMVDGVLGASSGRMPSWMTSPLASCLRSMWLSVGSGVFCHWLDQALTVGTGAPPSWREMQPREARVKALLGEDALAAGAHEVLDEKEFKKRLKALTGGKRKGGSGSAPPREQRGPAK